MKKITLAIAVLALTFASSAFAITCPGPDGGTVPCETTK